MCYQEEEGWGPEPIIPSLPWGEKASKCKWCSVDKKYCFCGFIIIWNWDEVEYENYKWCIWCQKNNHNTKYCWFPKFTKSPEFSNQEWKKTIKCSNCSERYKPVYHDEGKQCPKTYLYNDPRRWNNDWWFKTEL